MSDHSIAVRSGGAVATRRGMTPTRSAVAALAYVPAERVGFERLPTHLVEQLRDAGVLAGDELAANAERPVTKRRADGSCYQLIEAWWASDSRYVQIEAQRQLTAVGGGRFRPTSEWGLEGTVSTFPPGSRRATSQWHRPATSAGPGTLAIKTDDPLDTLPAKVVDPVRGGHTGAWRVWGAEGATEVIVASLADPKRVLVLRATRRAESIQLLDCANWRAESVDAAVVSRWRVVTDVKGRIDDQPPSSRLGTGRSTMLLSAPHTRARKHV